MASISDDARPNLRARCPANSAIKRECGCVYFSKVSIRSASLFIASSRVLPLAVSTLPPGSGFGSKLQAGLKVSQGNAFYGTVERRRLAAEETTECKGSACFSASAGQAKQAGCIVDSLCCAGG